MNQADGTWRRPTDTAIRFLTMSTSFNDSDKISVLLIARHYWPIPGAASNRLVPFVAALIAQGCEVTVLTRASLEGPGASVGPSGERIYGVEGDSTTGASLGRASKLLQFAASARRCLNDNGPYDIVVADPPPSVLFSLLGTDLKSTTLVYFLADRWGELLAGSENKLLRKLSPAVEQLEKAVVCKSDMTITVTQALKDWATATASRTEVLFAANGVSRDIFRTGLTPSKPPFPNGLPYFLYAGNFGEAHGAAVFAEAAEALLEEGHKFGVAFYGYGSDLAKIQAVSDRWPDNVVVKKPVPPEEVAALHNDSLAGLASVRTDASTCHFVPVKALASIACGAPLVYAGGGNFAREVRERNYGTQCSRDRASVAAGMAAMLESPWSSKERAKLSTNAHELYDQKKVLDALVQKIIRRVGSRYA